jgi:hypothetical protein
MKNIFTLLFLSIVSFNAFAQGCEDPAPSGGMDENAPKIIGYAQTQYEYHLTQDDTKNIDNHNSFKFKRVRLGVTGKIPYDFKYYALMEFSPFVSSTGNPYLLDVFISYNRYKWANISVGSFKQPFGLEVNTSCSKLYTIDRAAVSDQIVTPQRDMGIMIFGGTKEDLVNYKLALMNGRGLGTKDNNNKKDFIGRLILHPVDFISVGGSFRYGYPTKDTLTRTSWAIDLEIDYANFLVQAEYIDDKGDYNKAAGGGCGSDPLTLGDKRNGYYAQAIYKTYFNLNPVVKYEYFNTGVEDTDYALSAITFGLSYFFNDRVRLQANYKYNAEYNKAKTAEYPNDAVLIQLQAKF